MDSFTDMNKDKNQSQVIPVIKKQKKELSKLESLFNYRIKRVKRLKDALNLVSGQISNYQKQRAEIIFPIGEKTVKQQIVLIKVLVEVFDAKILKGKKQQEKFEELLLYFIENLIFDKGQEGLDDLYERFAQQTVEEAEEEAVQEEKEQLFNMMDFMGIEVSDEEKEKIMSDEVDDEFIHNFEKRLTEENSFNQFFENFNFRERKKSKQQIEREEKEAEELANISKTVKKVYKELVVELHPDKEMDDVKRAEKTALMQQVTEAYQNDDLFTLLSIQLVQIDGTDNTNLSDEKVEYFNTMLLNQARELEQQKKDLGHQAGLPRLLIQVLGKKRFDTVSKEIIEEEQLDAEIKLEQVTNQIKEVQTHNKSYIKNFVEENYKNIFERPSFPFFLFGE